MKTKLKKLLLFAFAAVISCVMLCSCGSDLEGTWTSQVDSETKIHFSGDKVRITHDGFKITGTYETDEEDGIILDLTDENGNKYRIAAEITLSGEKTLTLKNTEGQMEVFKK